MFDYIKGKISIKKTTFVVIDVNGIGFKVNIPVTTFDEIGSVDSFCKLYTFLDVKENALNIYGFHSTLQREVFQSLIKVSGIGAKIAISILSGLSIDNLISSIADKDVTMLTGIPGIGKKTAQRLIVELKDTFSDLSFKTETQIDISPEIKNIIKDAEFALISLGFKRRKVRKTIKDYLKNNDPESSEIIVKNVIKLMHK